MLSRLRQANPEDPMKKIGILFLVVLVALAGVFGWLLLSAGPGNAPQDTLTIELPDTYEN